MYPQLPPDAGWNKLHDPYGNCPTPINNAVLLPSLYCLDYTLYCIWERHGHYIFAAYEVCSNESGFDCGKINLYPLYCRQLPQCFEIDRLEPLSCRV